MTSPQPPLPKSPPPKSAARLASAYVLGSIVLALIVLLLMRGAGRFLVPLLLIGGIAYALHRFAKKIREPID